MAMTLRLTDDDEALVAVLAADYGGVSKHEAILRAVREQAAQHGHRDRVRAIATEVVHEYADALRRLGEGPS